MTNNTPKEEVYPPEMTAGEVSLRQQQESESTPKADWEAQLDEFAENLSKQDQIMSRGNSSKPFCTFCGMNPEIVKSFISQTLEREREKAFRAGIEAEKINQHELKAYKDFSYPPEVPAGLLSIQRQQLEASIEAAKKFERTVIIKMIEEMPTSPDEESLKKYLLSNLHSLDNK